MTRRSRAREVALQLLFQNDFNKKIDRSDIEQLVHDRLHSAELRTFCLTLFDGVMAHRKEIDEQISTAAENWALHRMPAVDRNVIRLGAFELLYYEDTPAAVAVDEAIELAKRYGSKDSPGFVNGVLDEMRKAAAPDVES